MTIYMTLMNGLVAESNTDITNEVLASGESMA